MLLKPLSYLDLKVNMFRFQANEVLSGLRTPNEGRYSHAKEICIKVDYQLFQTVLGAKFDENSTSVYLYSKNWQI